MRVLTVLPNRFIKYITKINARAPLVGLLLVVIGSLIACPRPGSCRWRCGQILVIAIIVVVVIVVIAGFSPTHVVTIVSVLVLLKAGSHCLVGLRWAHCRAIGSGSWI